MKILYIAYSCNPYAGSEDKIGWNVPYAACKQNEVWVITKEEQREPVERFLREHPTENLKFFFVDIPAFCKRIFKGFLYSGRLNVWHKRVFPLAKKLCAEHGIAVIHQITPIEFRAIGRYKDIPTVKFICGPLGGGENIPKGLKSYAKGHGMVEWIRNRVNGFYRFALKINGRLKRCDQVFYANYETRQYLKKAAGKNADGEVMTEIGIGENDFGEPKESKQAEKIVFLSAGRLVYRKGFELLLDALERLPVSSEYECRIVGGGEEYARLKQRCEKSETLKKHVVLTGKIPFEEMKREYSAANVFVMPSIRETTGSVVLEAMSYGLPVIAIDAFGGAVILNEESGWLYDGVNREDYIQSLTEILRECIERPEKVTAKGTNARRQAEKYLWEEKIKRYAKAYQNVGKNG